METNNCFVDGSFSCDIPLRRIGQLFNVTSTIVSQVNPHGIPFVWDMRLAENAGMFGKIGMLCKKLLYEELSNKIRQTDMMGIQNQYVAQMVKFSADSLEGDVVISPSLTIAEYATMMQNVQREEMERVLQKTYLQTFNMSAHIRSVYGIEREFERYHTRLKKKQIQKQIEIEFDHPILDQ